MTKTPVAVTRNIHGSVLIEMGEQKILTDLFFKDYWFARMNERRGLEASDLPQLTAIIGCHGVFDHWNPSSMTDYRWKAETPVFCATPAMVKSAKRAGFTLARLLEWGEVAEVEGLRIEAVAAQYAFGMKVNNYLLEAAGSRVFFGSEARDLAPIAAYRRSNQPASLAILPIDGATVLGQRLVAMPHEALQVAQILGASYLIPIHYNIKAIPPLIFSRATLHDLAKAAAATPEIKVTVLPTGERRQFML